MQKQNALFGQENPRFLSSGGDVEIAANYEVWSGFIDEIPHAFVKYRGGHEVVAQAVPRPSGRVVPSVVVDLVPDHHSSVLFRLLEAALEQLDFGVQPCS